MSKTKISRKLDPDRVASILVEALYYGDTTTTERWGITTRTLQNYRNMLAEDIELSHFFALKKDKFETEWANEIPAAIRAGLRFLVRAAEEANHKDPEVIHAIAGGMKIAAEIGLTKDMIDAKLGRLNRPDAEENRPVAAIGINDTDAIEGTTR